MKAGPVLATGSQGLESWILLHKLTSQKYPLNIFGLTI